MYEEFYELRRKPFEITPDPAFFFRRGTSGAGREILSDEELAGYHARAAQLAPPDLIEWLHRRIAGTLS